MTATETSPCRPAARQAGADAPRHAKAAASKRGSSAMASDYTDNIMFSAFFAAHAVLQNATDGARPAAIIFNSRNVAIETACLLFLELHLRAFGGRAGARRMICDAGGAVSYGAPGLAFLLLEAHEFTTMIAAGAGRGAARFSRPFSRSSAVTARMSPSGCCGSAR